MAIVNKQNKVLFYIKGFSQRFLPSKDLDSMTGGLFKNLTSEEKNLVEYRVNYYNKFNNKYKISGHSAKISDLLSPETPKSYYFDTYEFARYFPKKQKLYFEFGDVNSILDKPSICKSRPIFGNNENNVLLNLDKARHFVSVKDEKKFSEKKDILIGRAAVHQQHRILFYEKHFDHPLCDIGQINEKGGNAAWIKPKISIEKHLDYKFVLSLEGNDVATNLKWIMSSNSLAVSPPLQMETWYMEGNLKPGEHFIGLNENAADLEDKIQYYLDHELEAQEIIKNAKQYRNQFNNKNVEKLISLLILKKYFEHIF